MTTKKSSRASVTVQEPLFFKWQLMASSRLNINSDVLNALLHDDRQYTLAEVKALVADFMNGEV